MDDGCLGRACHDGLLLGLREAIRHRIARIPPTQLRPGSLSQDHSIKGLARVLLSVLAGIKLMMHRWTDRVLSLQDCV